MISNCGNCITEGDVEKVVERSAIRFGRLIARTHRKLTASSHLTNPLKGKRLVERFGGTLPDHLKRMVFAIRIQRETGFPVPNPFQKG